MLLRELYAEMAQERRARRMSRLLQRIGYHHNFSIGYAHGKVGSVSDYYYMDSKEYQLGYTHGKFKNMKLKGEANLSILPNNVMYELIIESL